MSNTAGSTAEAIYTCIYLLHSMFYFQPGIQYLAGIKK